MSQLTWTTIAVLGVGMFLWAAGCDDGGNKSSAPPATPAVARGNGAGNAIEGFTLSSPAFKEGETIPKHFTADGQDVSPPLTWSGLPEGTKELALICEDPDAPHGIWFHWVIYGIAPTISSLPEGVTSGVPMPERPGMAMQGRNSWPKENIGYRGPSPPPGKPHRYFFRLYALDQPLEVDSESRLTAAELRKAMEGKILGVASTMGTYGRPAE